MKVSGTLAALFCSLTLSTSSAAESARQVNIPAGALTSALELLAKQSQVEFIYSRQQLEGLQTRGVRGDLTAREALTRLLEGTGLVVTTHPSGAILITRTRQTAKKAAREASEGKPLAIEIPTGASEAEVLVTASRRTERLSVVPGGVAVITGRELEELAATSLSDYAGYLPGLGVVSYGHTGYDTVFIRGIAPQSVGATVATYIDEVPIGASSATVRGGLLAVDLDPTDLERVEVLKGPQGTLYGASSLGGVIKYVTRAPDLAERELSFSQEARATEYGSAGLRLYGILSTPLVQGQLGVRLSAFYDHAGGFSDDRGVGGFDTNRANNHGVRAVFLYRPSMNLSWRVTAMEQVDGSHGNNIIDYDIGSGRPLYPGYSQFRYVSEPASIRLELYAGELRYHLRQLELVASTSYSRVRPESIIDATTQLEQLGYNLSPLASQAAYDEAEPVTKVTQEVRLVSQRMGAVEWMLGGFFQHESLRGWYDQDFYGIPVAGVLPIHTQRRGTLTERAGFADATYYVSPTVDLTVGFRSSSLGQTFSRQAVPDIRTHQSFSESPTTYLATARWRPNGVLMVYGRAASGYRPGGGRAVPAGSPAGLPDHYTSDSIWSYEAGVKTELLERRLSVDFSAYWINWKRIQALQPDARLLIDGNAGTAVSRGMELQLRLQPVNGFTLNIDSALTDARYTQSVPLDDVQAGERLSYVPRWTAAARAEYSHPIGHGWQLQTAVNLQYDSTRLDGNGETLPSYTLWDVLFGARRGGLRFGLYVKNLTNRRVLLGYDAGLIATPYPFAVGRPRTLGLGFTSTLQ